MSQSIFKKPDFQAKQGRNGFDLSRRRQFTCMAGQLLPVFKDLANPGDKYKLNSVSFVRTEALQTAAFMQLKGRVEWFFVPMTQLFTKWNEFFNGTDDVMTTAFDAYSGSDGSMLPAYDISNLIHRFETTLEGVAGIKPTAAGMDGNYFSLYTDMFGIPKIWNFRRLLDLLGYGSVDSYYLDGAVADAHYIYPFLDFLAYHKIYHSHYNLTDWIKNNPRLYNLDQFVSFSAAQTAKDRTYFDILSTIHYRPYRKDYFTNIMPQPMFGDSFASYLTNNGLFESGVNYRSKINPENYFTSDSGSAEDNSMNSLTPWSNSSVLNSGAPDGNYANSTLSLLTGSGGGSLAGLSTADIRSMFALDRLLRVTAFAGGHYEDQTLAHFGYKMPQGISKEAYFLGSQGFDININEVVATATTATKEGSSTTVTGAGTSIGDIAGKGFTSSDSQGTDCDFTAPCHGIIMGIFSIEPLPMYASMGCETVNRYRDPYDFYRPEFDDIGMQPQFGVFTSVQNNPNSQNINGWTYRWLELKTSFDVVNEGFWNTDKYPWVGYKQSVYPMISESGFADGSFVDKTFQFFVSPQYTNSIFLQSVPFYRNPTASVALDDKTYLTYKYNPVFNTANTQSWKNPANSAENVYSKDNFLVNTHFKCFKTSIMSVHSLNKVL